METHTAPDKYPRATARKVIPPLPPRWSAKVVGVTFAPGYPDILDRLQAVQQLALSRGEGLPVVLIHNADNANDTNAIEVWVPAADGLIGHIPAHLAERLAPRLDAGEKWQAEVEEVLINPDRPERPGISVKVWKAAA